MLTSIDLRLDTANLRKEDKYSTKIEGKFIRVTILQYRGLYFIVPRTAEAISLNEVGNLRRTLGVCRHRWIAYCMAGVFSVSYPLRSKRAL